MNTMDKIIKNFAIDLDKYLMRNDEYQKASEELHRFLETEIPEDKIIRLEAMVGRLTAAVSNAANESGIRLGAKLVAALLSE